MIRIEPTNDAQLLTSLCEEVHSLHHLLYPHVFKPFNLIEFLPVFENTLKATGCRAFIAHYFNEPAGYILGIVKKNPTTAYKYGYDSLEIDQLLVLEKFRGKGIAHMLMEKIQETAQTEGIKLLELSHWEDNPSAGIFFS